MAFISYGDGMGILVASKFIFELGMVLFLLNFMGSWIYIWILFFEDIMDNLKLWRITDIFCLIFGDIFFVNPIIRIRK